MDQRVGPQPVVELGGVDFAVRGAEIGPNAEPGNTTSCKLQQTEGRIAPVRYTAPDLRIRAAAVRKADSEAREALEHAAHQHAADRLRGLRRHS